MKRIIFIFSCLLIFVCSCNKEKVDIQLLTIGSEEVYRYANAILVPCLVVKEKGDENWSYIFGSIEGFDYERGYEYTISVRTTEIENPPADASSVRRVLVTVLDKTPKDSENLPPIYLDYPVQ